MPRFPRSTIKRLRVFPDHKGELHPACEMERSFAALSAEGFNHLQVHCLHCRFVKDIAFEDLTAGRHAAEVTLAEIVPKLVCGKCRNPPYGVEPGKPPVLISYQHSQ